MSNTVTKRLINAFYNDAEVRPYFSGFFQVAPENIYSSEEIEIDIVRSEEDVSIAIQNMGAGYRFNSDDLYTTKGFKAPVHKEAIALNAYDLIKRQPGRNPFEDPQVRADIITKVFSSARKVERKIRRAIELQASQVMQTGAVTLRGEDGNALYTLDYKPRASHFPTAGVSWATATLAEKISDLTALCDQIRTNGLQDPDEISIGADAWEALVQTDGFLDRFNARRADFGSITSNDLRGGGGIYRGVIEVGNYRLDVYTYSGRYKDPQDGVSKQYLEPGSVVVRASQARLDGTFGAIPNIGQSLGATSQLIPELPNRLSSPAAGMDLFTNTWLSNDGENLFCGVGARPLCIPTNIDAYGCLKAL